MLDTPISIDVGGNEVSISLVSFSLGRVSQDFEFCVAVAAAVQSWFVACLPSRNNRLDVGCSRIGFATHA